jgi:hypothetical protein
MNKFENVKSIIGLSMPLITSFIVDGMAYRDADFPCQVDI